MNIFYLDKDPVQAAQWQVDKHVVKMIVESAQMLSTAHRVLDGAPVEVTYKVPSTEKLRKKKVWVIGDDRNDILYSATHINHPSNVWIRQSVENYNWLVDHMFALGEEYTYRYGKKHATITKLGYELQSPPQNLKEWDMTIIPSCMDEEFIVGDDPILNYRNYYAKGKAKLHKWKNREVPDWIL